MTSSTDNLLYLDIFRSKKVNSANRAYWSKILKKYTFGKYENEWKKFVSSKRASYDDSYAPVLMFYNEQLHKCIRIIQYSPDEYDSKYKYQQFLTSWITETDIDNKKIPELVIYLLLTRENRLKAEKLISLWINESDEDKVRQEIKRIYDGQRI